MFFLGEYSNMIIMSTLTTILFFGGWTNNILFDFENYIIFCFIFKILIFCFIYILVRASLPRYRYDQLMDIGWKIFLPWAITFLWIILIWTLSRNIYLYQYPIYTKSNINNMLFFTNSILDFDNLDFHLLECYKWMVRKEFLNHFYWFFHIKFSWYS
jgi:hypothetical protein